MSKVKKKLNTNNKKVRKKIILSIVLLIFLLFTSSCLVLIERNYFFAEKIFKDVSSKINSYVVSNFYSVNNSSSNVLLSKIEYLQKENNELRNNLKLDEKTYDYTDAQIINHTIKNWYDKVEISKGFNAGIKKDDVVISKQGLVGFVSKVSKNASEVSLITSVSDKKMLSVLVQTSYGNLSGVLKDYDLKKGLFKVTDVMSKNPILAGDKVVLSGYDNDLYKGIYIGMVVKEQTSNYGLSKTLWVESSVNFDDLLFVQIIKEKK